MPGASKIVELEMVLTGHGLSPAASVAYREWFPLLGPENSSSFSLSFFFSFILFPTQSDLSSPHRFGHIVVALSLLPPSPHARPHRGNPRRRLACALLVQEKSKGEKNKRIKKTEKKRSNAFLIHASSLRELSFALHLSRRVFSYRLFALPLVLTFPLRNTSLVSARI